MYYRDLSNYNHDLAYDLKEVLNIGWLEKGNYFKQKNIPNLYIFRLEKIFCGNSNIDVTVNQMRGFHKCSFCGASEVKITCDNAIGYEILGSSEIWIVSANREIYYAAPSLIIHYIKDHNYCPPEEFLDAILNFSLTDKFDGQTIYESLLRTYRFL